VPGEKMSRIEARAATSLFEPPPSEPSWFLHEAAAHVQRCELEHQAEAYLGLARTKIEELKKDPATKPFVLDNTGWGMLSQVGVFIKDAVFAPLDDRSFAEAIAASAEKTGQDLWGLFWEHFERRMTLPIFAQFQNVNGQRRLVANKYDNRPYEETTGPKERDGVVRKVVKKIATLLTELPPNSTIVMSSPRGWSGFGFDYPESQAYVFQVGSAGQFVGHTIRSGMSIAENKEFLSKLAQSAGQEIAWSETTGEKETIKDILRHHLVFDGQEKEITFHQVANTIQAVRGEKPFLKDEKGIRTIEEVFKHHEDNGSLSLLHQRAQVIIDHFQAEAVEDFADLSTDSIKKLALKMGYTVIALFKAMEDFETEKDAQKRARLVYAPMPTISSQKAKEIHQQIEEIRGFHGGGRPGSISGLVGLPQTRTNAEGGKEVLCCGKWYSAGTVCPDCGKTV
jgi:hypothetical protein